MTAGLDDARLGGGDGLHRIPQHAGVVQTDVGEHGGLRRGDHIGGIEFTAHAHLAYHNIARLPGKPGQTDGCHQLKLRGGIRHAVSQRAQLLHQGAQGIVRDRCAVDLHTLIEAEDVRRGVQSRFISGGTQHGGQHGAGAALAVGAGDVDILYVPLRMAKQAQQRIDTAEPGHTAPPVHLVDVCQRLIQRHGRHRPSSLSAAVPGRVRSAASAATPAARRYSR